MSEKEERTLTKVYHATLQPHVMEHVKVGVFKVKGIQPQFVVTCSPEEGENNLSYKSVQLVDFKSMTYELVYNCQNFGATPITIAIQWVDGQTPITGRSHQG